MIEKNIRRIDKNRAQAREIIAVSKWEEELSCHLAINSNDWDIKEVAPSVAYFAVRWFERKNNN